MSIFGKFRRAKQAADQEKGKKATETKPPPTPYRHVPTHAATDALLGAPGTWREQDKKAIQEQNKRRSQLSRNRSSLSNVTTLNRDQSFTSTERGLSAADRRKHYSLEGTTTMNPARRSQIIGTRSLSNTKFSARGIAPPNDSSSAQMEVRRSRLDPAEPVLAPYVSPVMDQPSGLPYQHYVAPSKDVKFYLPSSREISPSHSSTNSNLSSQDSSSSEPPVPVRHPRRHYGADEFPVSPARKTDGENHFHQQQRRMAYRHVKESPTLPAVSSPLDHFPVPSPSSKVENDLSFIDFGDNSSRPVHPNVTHF